MALKLGTISQVVIIFSVTLKCSEHHHLNVNNVEDDLVKVSVTVCRPHQNFLCVNQTHYKRCIILNRVNQIKLQLLTSTFYCGSYRCCQSLGKWPCTYNCSNENNFSDKFQSLIKRTKRDPHILSDIKENKGFGQILFVKTIISRQRDPLNYLDTHEEETFKPSYREHCRNYRRWLVQDVTTMGNQFVLNRPKTYITPVGVEDVVYRNPFQIKQPDLLCNINNLGQKLNIVGTCTNYFVCLRKAFESFQWRLSECPAGTVFVKRSQLCVNNTIVSCKRS